MPYDNPHIQELIDFQGSDRMKTLHESFWGRGSLRGCGIVPHWDISDEAKDLNWEVFSDNRKNLRLHTIKMSALLRHIYEPSAYAYPGIYKEIRSKGTQDQFLRIIDRWIAKVALPPPVLTSRDDQTIGKIDGFHRLVVCSLLGVDELPCWILDPTSLDLITPNK